MSIDPHLDALLSMPVLSGPVVSPDGRWVAWNWSRLGPATDVFAAPTDGSAPPLRMTGSHDDTQVVSWTPDSRAVLAAQDHDGDERARLFRVALEHPGVMEPLTEESPGYYVRGGQTHPNGRWLIYGANFDVETGKEIEPTWVLRHDLKTGVRHTLARPERSAFAEPQLSNSGEHVLYHRSDIHPEGRQVWLVDIEGHADREILNFGSRTKVSASWFPDGRRILFLVEAETHRRIGVWDMDGESTRWLLDDPQRGIEYAFVPPNGGPVVAVEMREARVRSSLLNAESGEEARMPDLPGNLIPLAPANDGAWISLHYNSRNPVDLVRYSLKPGENPSSLTRLWERTSLDPKSLAPAEDFRWRSVDGLEIQGWLYRATGRSIGTVVLVHGGPTSISEDRFNAQVQYLVGRGFDVLSPNYRGSIGFGLEFQEKIKEDGWGGREQEDIRTGIEALISAGIAEPYRVGVTGTSYGGYSAWWAITHYPPETTAAAAPICGMTDLTVDYHTTRPDLRPYSEEMMGGTPEDIPERYTERSPINFIQNVRGSLLIVQGLKDPNVTPENVQVVVEELDRRRIPYELLTFEDEGHGISRPDNLKVLYPRLADFFEEAFLEDRRR
ncbi:MAG TPA: alpha/beta fold hydrolase [Rubrobacteraceae bacterium]|nr:alpha/beta fold hydrolase [Rubrobacteraceae bacterium]